uniref:Serpentine receptor class gamma n=1 Tax=Panagrellus redivivus TaxID=6233 RepID=A0A7E4ZYW2_PANRE
MWQRYKSLWSWRYFIIYCIIAILFTVALALILHIYLVETYVDYATVHFIDRIFKAGFYFAAFLFEISAVAFRVLMKHSHKLDKVDVSLLVQSLIATTCWVINVIMNHLMAVYGFFAFLIFWSNVMVVCGFILP